MPEAGVVTAAEGSFPGLAAALRGIPAVVEEHPLIAFEPPLDWLPVDEAVRNLGRFDALAFTSPRSAAAFGRRATSGDAGAIASGIPPVWAAGAGTAAPYSPTPTTTSACRRCSAASSRASWPPCGS